MIIYDLDEMKRFHDILPSLGKDEAWFLSLAARKKYLTGKQKESIRLGDTLMFGRKLVKHNGWEAFRSAALGYEAPEDAYLSLSGHSIPHSCMVVYFSVNPSDAAAAAADFKKKIADGELAMQRGDSGFSYLRMEGMLMASFQKCRSRRIFMDMDVDMPIDDPYEVLDALHDAGLNMDAVHPIITRGGMHILIETASAGFGKTLNPPALALMLNERFKGRASEIAINRNAMVPLPGTRQGGFGVRLLQPYVPRNERMKKGK